MLQARACCRLVSSSLPTAPAQPGKVPLHAGKGLLLGSSGRRRGHRHNAREGAGSRRLAHPHKPKTVEEFLGPCLVLQEVCTRVCVYCCALVQLLQKDSNFAWTEQCQTAFSSLRRALIEAPAPADPSLPFTLDTDANGLGVGGVLSQARPDRQSGDKTKGRTQTYSQHYSGWRHSGGYRGKRWPCSPKQPVVCGLSSGLCA